MLRPTARQPWDVSKVDDRRSRRSPPTMLKGARSRLRTTGRPICRQAGRPTPAEATHGPISGWDVSRVDACASRQEAVQRRHLEVGYASVKHAAPLDGERYSTPRPRPSPARATPRRAAFAAHCLGYRPPPRRSAPSFNGDISNWDTAPTRGGASARLQHPTSSGTSAKVYAIRTTTTKICSLQPIGWRCSAPRRSATTSAARCTSSRGRTPASAGTARPGPSSTL